MRLNLFAHFNQDFLSSQLLGIDCECTVEASEADVPI